MKCWCDSNKKALLGLIIYFGFFLHALGGASTFYTIFYSDYSMVGLKYLHDMMLNFPIPQCFIMSKEE